MIKHEKTANERKMIRFTAQNEFEDDIILKNKLKLYQSAFGSSNILQNLDRHVLYLALPHELHHNYLMPSKLSLGNKPSLRKVLDYL